ncbi:MAG: RNA methyltransferase [Clostridia bacterium]|nr:RNA methyltransferase [Clostridia bacterium]
MNTLLKITSKENGNIKEISNLQKSSKFRKEQGVFVLEGVRLCEDALDNGFEPVKVFFSTSATEKYNYLLNKFLSYDIFEISDSLFNKISDTVSPQGVLCVFKIPELSNDSIKKSGKYIALENLQDPSNLGAISRTAEAFGIDGLILCGCCDPYSSKSLRASMGALLRIPLYFTDDMFELFEKYNVKSFASVVTSDAESISNMDFGEGCAVIIGNEGNGISEITKEKSDYLFTIPMSGKAESLNAAVAASIIIWEMCKC